MALDEFQDLSDVLPEKLFDHPDCYDPDNFRRWESVVATPALEALGYQVGEWRTVDEDAGGPLVRSVELTRNGKTRAFHYG